MMTNLMLGLLNGPEVVVILALALILFGSKRLPELARGLGNGLKEFKKATREVTDDLQTALYEEPRMAPKQLPVSSPNIVPASDPSHTVAATDMAHATPASESAHAMTTPATVHEPVEHPTSAGQTSHT